MGCLQTKSSSKQEEVKYSKLARTLEKRSDSLKRRQQQFNFEMLQEKEVLKRGRWKLESEIMLSKERCEQEKGKLASQKEILDARVWHQDRRESAIEKKQCASERRENALKRREKASEKRENALEKREKTMKERENTSKKRENAVEKRESAVERRENAAVKKEVAKQKSRERKSGEVRNSCQVSEKLNGLIDCFHMSDKKTYKIGDRNQPTHGF